MADKEDPQRPESLTCPLCIDAFKDPTLLRCGHTFCSVCLDRYDGQHRGRAYMECPVCKKRTKLGQHRVTGLAPNFTVEGLKDELHGKVIGSSSNFCSFHIDIYKDILCEDCEEFICLSCFVDKHQGHKIKKKEALEADLKKKREALDQKIQLKKVQIKMSKSEQDKRDIHSHLVNLVEEIEEAFNKKATILLENKRRLSDEAKKVCMDTYKIVTMGIARQCQSIDNIERDLTATKGNASKCFIDSDVLKALQVKLTDLENELEKDIDGTSIAHARERVRNTRFRQADGAVLDLGCLEQKANAMDSDLPQIKTVPGVCTNTCSGSSRVADIPSSVESTVVTLRSRSNLTGSVSGTGEGSAQDCPGVGSNAEELQNVPGCSTMGDIHVQTAVQNLPATIVRKIDLPDSVSGMANAPSQDCPGVSTEVQGVPTSSQNMVVTIMRKIDLPAPVSGMAAGPSRDAVVIGYGENRHGTDFFSVLGAKKPHMTTKVGPVYDVSFLSDGRLVVSHGKSLRIYSTQDGIWYRRVPEYMCREYPAFSIMLCTDQHDMIYAVSNECDVNIFNGQSTSRQKIITPCSVECSPGRATQICVMTTGTMIKSPCNSHGSSSVTVYQTLPGRRRCVPAPRADDDEEEYLYSALDSHDRLLVAKLSNRCDVFSLTRYMYTEEELEFTESTIFKPLRLPHPVDDTSSWCYMVSLTPNLIAFATGIHLYFMQLPV